jgi:glucosylceramidase
MAHFSKYIRPGAKRIDFESTDKDLQVSAATNPDGSHVVIIFNPSEEEKVFELSMKEAQQVVSISPQALQTIVLNPKK